MILTTEQNDLLEVNYEFLVADMEETDARNIEKLQWIIDGIYQEGIKYFCYNNIEDFLKFYCRSQILGRDYSQLVDDVLFKDFWLRGIEEFAKKCAIEGINIKEKITNS